MATRTSHHQNTASIARTTLVVILSSLVLLGSAPLRASAQRRVAPRRAEAARGEQRYNTNGARNAGRYAAQGGERRGGERGGERGEARPGTGERGGKATPPPRVTPKPYLLPIASTPTSQTFPIPPVLMAKPIGLVLTGEETAGFAGKHLGPNDLALIMRPEEEAMMTSFSARRGIFLRASDTAQAEQTIKWAREHELRDVAFSIEGLPKEELVSRLRQVYLIAHSEGLRLTFGPKVTDLQNYAPDFAQYADTLVIQAQRYQGGDEFGTTVNDLIGRVRKTNPQIKIWVQVALNPPYALKRTGEQVIEDILDVSDAADGIFLSYAPQKWEAARRVLEALRPLDKSSLVAQPKRANVH